MAIIWQANKQDKKYEVRRAGASLRLYTDGVFHSQFNPKHLGAGSLWDMLAMPSQLLYDWANSQALVLGVGGGAVIKYLQSYHQWQHIVGVDLDPIHLDIAKRIFGVKTPEVRLQCAEAQAWLSHHRQRKFDLIVDDLFGEDVDEYGLPVRAIPADIHWLNTIKSHLSPDGILVMNLESKLSAQQVLKAVKKEALFRHAVRLCQARYENEIIVLANGKIRTPVKQVLLARMQQRYLDQLRITQNLGLY